MEIDNKTIKMLASEKKVQIMKRLLERRKMPSELSKELSLAPSTVAEHLKDLEKSEMIKKVNTGHKWVYYELTSKSKDILKPKIPTQSIFMLSLGILMVVGSLLAISAFSPDIFTNNIATAVEPSTEYSQKAGQTDAITREASYDSNNVSYIDLSAIILIVGIILFAYGLWRIRKNRRSYINSLN